jgi:hypothetical protein
MFEAGGQRRVCVKQHAALTPAVGQVQFVTGLDRDWRVRVTPTSVNVLLAMTSRGPSRFQPAGIAVA